MSGIVSKVVSGVKWFFGSGPAEDGATSTSSRSQLQNDNHNHNHNRNDSDSDSDNGRGGARQRTFTLEELSRYDGSIEGEPVLVGIRGRVYDVSSQPAYAKGREYNVFAGCDATVLLATSSLKPTDKSFADLSEKEIATLESWEKFFVEKKRYPLVGVFSCKDYAT
eukprot:ANDGO_03962.mRNA.1 putative steroid-binding protein 3